MLYSNKSITESNRQLELMKKQVILLKKLNKDLKEDNDKYEKRFKR